MPRRRRLLVLVTSAYLLALGVVGLWPRHVDEDVPVASWPPVLLVRRLLGLDAATTYTLVEVGANLLWFIPFGVLVAGARRRRPVLSGLLAGFLVSGAIELAQLLFRPDRTASFADVAVNTAGTVVGAALVVLWSRRRQRQPSLAAER